MQMRIGLLSVLVTSMTLTACGGSGDTATSTPTPKPSSTIVTSVPPATYAATSGENLAYTTLNAERSRCGFGLLAQNSKLDQVAAGYLRQDDGSTYVSPADRAKAAGYRANKNEDVTYRGERLKGADQVAAFNIQATATDNAESAVRLALGDPYVALVALDGSRDIGLAWGLYQNSPTLVAVTGVPENTKKQDADKVLTYPCEGSTGVLASAKSQTPDGVRGATTWGQPVLVKSASDVYLRVVTASITGPYGAVALHATYSDRGDNGVGQVSTDPYAYCRLDKACVIPTVLAANTDYSVTITGLTWREWDERKPFTTTFSFRTGAR